MTKVTVDRQTWLRGEGSSNSYLLRISDRRMCCLGSVCVVAGLEEGEFLNLRSPDEAPNKLQIAFPNLLTTETEVEYDEYDDDVVNEVVSVTDAGQELMAINDDPATDDAEKEEALMRVGLTCGIEFEFVN